MPRKQVEEELSKDQILRVARSLFSSKGYHGVSMRDIAKELGYSHGSLYYHFKNKGELFNELLDKDFALLNTTMAKVVAQEHALKDILKAFIDFGFQYPHHYEIMFMTKEESFLEHSSPVASYTRFVEEVAKFNVPLQDIYFLFISLHGFISYHMRSGTFSEYGRTLADQYVDYLMSTVK